MVRSLWTAATGMVAQQTNVDTIANNLANVNTIGYKTETVEFKSLLYQNIQSKTTTANGATKPVGAQVGLGVRNSSITSIFRQGNMTQTGNTSNFAIDGTGMFAVRGGDGKTYYTRNGNFNFSMGGKGMMLCNTEGYPLLDSKGKEITFPRDIAVEEIVITKDGEFMYPNPNNGNNLASLGIKLGVYQFTNPAGLNKKGSSLYEATAASGPVMNESTNNNLTKSKLMQGYLEGSNVQVVDEMVNMIVAQRAYEMNSKAIQASDDMLQQANQLKR